MRASGKHNDLDNVGYTARHHTFFEMLGNFSFGDYFKDRAIELAWKLVTKEFGLPPARLAVTVYAEDDQAFDLWKKIAGLPDGRIIRIGTSRQLLGDGRHRARVARARKFSTTMASIFRAARQVRPTTMAIVSSKSGIWSSCNTSSCPTGQRLDLPKPSIDTGMGLERIAAVLQGCHDNYETDLFGALIQAVADRTGVDPERAAAGLPPRHRRPFAGDVVPDRRWRAAVERRPRLCAAPHHAPRHAPRRTAGRQGAR